MLDPGASSSTSGDEFENDDTTSPVVVEPTVIAVEMQAGNETPSMKPSLPEAIAVAMLAERRLSIDALRESASQSVVDLLPPRLMFTDAIEYVVRSAYTRSRPAIWSLVYERAQGSSGPPQFAP